MSLHVRIVHSTQWVRRNKNQIEQFSAYKGVQTIGVVIRQLSFDGPVLSLFENIVLYLFLDLEKQTRMAAVSKERDNLQVIINTYKSLFNTTQELAKELGGSSFHWPTYIYYVIN